MTDSKKKYSAIPVIAALLVALACGAFCGVSFAVADEQASSGDTNYYLPVFQTSDVHGYLADISGDNPLYLLAYIADKVNDVRGSGESLRKDKAILLDSGDIYQGNTLSSLSKGNPMSAAYAAMGYDAVTIGNHEFDWGIETTIDADQTMMDYRLGELVGVNSIPVVASNIYKNNEKITFAKDYIILEKTAIDTEGREATVRVAVIGFVSDYKDEILNERFTGAGYRVSLDFAALNALAQSLESSGAADATIVLSHEDASIIANGLGAGSVVDLVLGGHSHDSLSGKTSANLVYIQPECYGVAYTYCELAFTVNEGDAVFAGIKDANYVSTVADKTRLVKSEANANELDASIVAISDVAINAAKDIFDTKIGHIVVDAPKNVFIEGSGGRASVAGNWDCSIIARIGAAEIGMYNGGGVRTSFVIDPETGKRDITIADIYTMMPFSNKVYTYEITYEELLSVLNYSMSEEGKALFTNMVGIDCLFKDGVVVALVTSSDERIYYKGTWLDGWRDKKVRVAINEYMATTDPLADEGIHNPFIAWTSTSRFINSDYIDNEQAIVVLTQEGQDNGGLLSIDTQAHFVNADYPLYQLIRLIDEVGEFRAQIAEEYPAADAKVMFAYELAKALVMLGIDDEESVDATYKALYDAYQEALIDVYGTVYNIITVDGEEPSSLSHWRKGSEQNLVIVLDAEVSDDEILEHFVGLYDDETELVRDVDYTIARGSVIVTVMASVLDAMESNIHILHFTFDNGSATLFLDILDADAPDPSTDDDDPVDPVPYIPGLFDGILFWWNIVCGLLIVTLVSFMAIALGNRRNTSEVEETEKE
ncbi:MAG: bifunctional metallophosphatase/5'-nucleotidase [Eggerthellaceae bacterium]|nr:bifunctional metallophosphatase/5'-nucleotidase [Eggerthellaceae bacterium]